MELVELCVAKQNGLLCIDIGNMAKVLHRRSKLPTNLRHLRWGSEEWMEAFTCNVMPDFPDAAIHLNHAKNKKDQGSWADWTEEMDKTSEVSSTHSKTGLTNNQTNQQKTIETCCEVSCQTCQDHIPAAVPTSNSEKGKSR